MEFNLLDKVDSIETLRELKINELNILCDDIRRFLIEKVEQSGGHLASNLGAVELSVAIHRVFDSPSDHIIFDVGHQSYVHKMLTGRMHRFDDLRKPGGLSGFTSRKESEHDPFGAGHSSTAISAALGFAESDKLCGKDAYTVAIVGDGAYTGGMVHEALNNCNPDLPLVVILNENGMSISKNKGAFASYLSRVRASRRYINAKEGTRSLLNHIPLLGPAAKWCISSFKRLVKRVVCDANYFEDLGFYYIGPIDGNDYKKVEKALSQARSLGKCVFVHVKTTKGKGLDRAEEAPEKFHSLASRSMSGKTFHGVAADEIISLAEKNADIVAVTAAMGIGTGLSEFEKKYPDRYFDVGIAEEHALTFAAGLAANGLKPLVAIYSTFLQRGYDNIVHDIALQNLPVKIFIDRAGIAMSDGPTHHGIFDVSFLSHIPNMEILSPADFSGLRRCTDYAYGADAPVAVRYPNSDESEVINEHFAGRELYTSANIRCDFDISDPPSNLFITYGLICENVVNAKRILGNMNIACGIILLEQLKPYDVSADFVRSLIKDGTHIVYAEEGIKNGGAGMILKEKLSDIQNMRFDIAAIDDNFAWPEDICDVYDHVGLSSDKLSEYFKQL